MLLLRFVAGILSVGLMFQGARIACGQDYPSKPVRIITSAAGGGSDFDARLVAQGITAPLGQPVIVDNRTPILAPDAVSKAPPDGYTLLVGGSSIWLSPLLRNTGYDPVRDFSPISLIEREVSVLVVHPSVPAKAVKELIALAKARPGELNYASTVLGGPAHLGAEQFKSMAGVNVVNVSYKGDAAILTALISGEVQLAFVAAGLVAPHLKSGKLRAVAVTGAQPSMLLPGLPTVAASGLPGFASGGVTAILAPGKTPTAIINRLNQEVVRLVSRPEIKERFLNNGVETVGNSPEEFVAIIKADMARLEKLIKDTGIKVN